jgi:hypothetical protein
MNKPPARLTKKKKIKKKKKKKKGICKLPLVGTIKG